MTESLAAKYQSLHDDVLICIAEKLKSHLEEMLASLDRIDSVATRAKSPKRFAAKALKQEGDGNLKYSNPLAEIQDQIGARINVLYLSDIEKVKTAIGDYFHAVEWQKKEPETDMEFGYFGEHYILKIPDDAVPEGSEEEAPEFFELQIKTLFQHAWSEASHDIGYKAPRALTSLEQRQMAFSAAQAWGADQIFTELAKSLLPNNDV